MFLKNKNIIFKMRRSKVTDYAALRVKLAPLYMFKPFQIFFFTDSSKVVLLLL